MPNSVSFILDWAEWRDMRAISSLPLLCLGLLAGLFAAVPARAAIELGAHRLDLPGAQLQDVSLRIDEDGGGGLSVHLVAGRAKVESMGWRRVGVILDGTLHRDQRMRWLLDGTLQLAGAPGGAASRSQVHAEIDEAGNTFELDLAQARARASVALPLDQPTHATITLDDLPAGWLQGLLGTVWSGHASAGQLDARMALDVHDSGIQSSGRFTLKSVGFDTPSGTLAGEGVTGSGRLDLDTRGESADVSVDATLKGGQLLLGPLYAELPGHAVSLTVRARATHGAVNLTHLRVSDPDALQLDGALAFDATGDLQTMRLDRFQASLPAAYQRYGKAWLDTLGIHDARLRGGLSGRLDLGPDGIRSFAFDTQGLSLATGDGRLSVSNLRGGVDWARQGRRPATALSWQQLQVYRLPAGAAQMRWRSVDGQLGLQEPVSIPLLEGQLRLGQLDWRPGAAKGQRLATSLALTGVDMAAFSKAVGWPQFPGTLGGAIPGLRWVDDRVELDGGLSVHVFGGYVNVTGLSLQQPFGASPVLDADIALEQLDLGAITSVFDFGSITGPLDGSIENLRLVDWSPVAFKARLIAPRGGRISQRAVNNLTSVGGGGIVAGLQGAVLRLFKTFGYDRIGLNCTLADSVCHMSGLERANGGYTIVSGSGIPHLEVIGHQSEVDWPTLVRRLDAATHGASPEVR